jgi:hypothetical protein
MNIQTKAIETTGTINEKNELIIDEPLPLLGPTRVRVLILVSNHQDPKEDEWLGTAQKNPVFDFLKESSEDIYKVSDGNFLNH